MTQDNEGLNRPDFPSEALRRFQPVPLVPIPEAQPIPPPPQSDGFSDMFRGLAKDDLSDLTDVTDEDVLGAAEGEDLILDTEIDDLFRVSREDIVGRQRQPRVKYRIAKPLDREPPPTSIGGIR